MSMKLTLYGHSDDCIETRLDTGKKTVEDEFHLRSETSKGGPGLYDVMTLRVTSIGGARGCKVYVIYDGCWAFTPAFLDDGRGFPDAWKFTIGKAHEYSASLTIEADEPIVLDYDGKE